MDKYEKYIRVTAFADMGLFTMLALPFVSVFVLSSLFDLGVILGDARALPDLTPPFVQLTINLVGIFGLFTVWLRLQKPVAQYAFPIAIVKLSAAALFGFSVIMGAPFILLILLVVDLLTALQLIFRRPAS